MILGETGQTYWLTRNMEVTTWVSVKEQAGDVSTISLTLGVLMGGSKCREHELDQEVLSEHRAHRTGSQKKHSM